MLVSKEYATLVCTKWATDRDTVQVTMEGPSGILGFTFTGVIEKVIEGLVLIARGHDPLLVFDFSHAEAFDFADDWHASNEEPPILAGRTFRGRLIIMGMDGHWYCQVERIGP